MPWIFLADDSEKMSPSSSGENVMKKGSINVRTLTVCPRNWTFAYNEYCLLPPPEYAKVPWNRLKEPYSSLRGVEIRPAFFFRRKTMRKGRLSPRDFLLGLEEALFSSGVEPSTTTPPPPKTSGWFVEAQSTHIDRNEKSRPQRASR